MLSQWCKRKLGMTWVQHRPKKNRVKAKGRVYCIDCIYFVHSDGSECGYPSNVVKYRERSAVMVTERRTYKQGVAERNSSNNCSNYDEKDNSPYDI